MKILIFLATLSYANADVESCKILRDIYEAFECIPRCIDATTGEPTKYSCLKSPYVLQYSVDTCYFQGKKYAVGEQVAQQYPNLEGTNQCTYSCSGGYFDFDIGAPIIPPTTDVCMSSVLYSQDQFNEHQAPIYAQGSTNASPNCPYRWTSGDGSDITFPTSVCENKADCCQFMGKDIVIGESVEYEGQQTMCYCGCPPYMHCFSTGPE